MDVIIDRPSSRLRRLGGAGLGLGVLAAALVGLPSAATAAAAPAFGTTWVTSESGNSVTELSPSGAVVGTPINGVSTGLADPQGVVSDTAGDIFVTNFANNSITEYAPGAQSNAAPIATISGSQTGLSGPTGITLSGATLWVTDATTNTLEAFGAGQNGNVLPSAAIYGSKTKLDNPVAVGVSQGFFLFVVNDPTGRAPSVEAFLALLDGSSAGNQKPVFRLTGSKTLLSDPRAVAVNSIDQSIDVANAGSNAVTEYSEPTGNTKPDVVLSGSATKLDGPNGIALDAVGRLNVTNAGDNALRVFAAKAHGNVAPERSSTGLTDPGGATVLAAPPSAPRTVSAVVHNHSVALSWKSPSSIGGGLAGYQVVASRSKSGLDVDEPSVTTTATHFTRQHLKNGVRYYFAIFAVNQAGSSPAAETHATPATVPGTPRTVKVTPHHDALAVTWKAPKHNGGRTVTRYVIRFATCTIGKASCHAPSVTVKGTKRALTLTGLSGGTSYHVEVTAKNSQGSGKPSKPVTGVPTG